MVKHFPKILASEGKATMSTYMMWMRTLFTDQKMCIMLKIKLLVLKLDFITLKSNEGLAALKGGPK